MHGALPISDVPWLAKGLFGMNQGIKYLQVLNTIHDTYSEPDRTLAIIWNQDLDWYAHLSARALNDTVILGSDYFRFYWFLYSSQCIYYSTRSIRKLPLRWGWGVNPAVHQLPVVSAHKRPEMHSFNIFIVASLSKLLNKLSSCRWFGTPWRSYDITL